MLHQQCRTGIDPVPAENAWLRPQSEALDQAWGARCDGVRDSLWIRRRCGGADAEVMPSGFLDRAAECLEFARQTGTAELVAGERDQRRARLQRSQGMRQHVAAFQRAARRVDEEAVHTPRRDLFEDRAPRHQRRALHRGCRYRH